MRSIVRVGLLWAVLLIGLVGCQSDGRTSQEDIRNQNATVIALPTAPSPIDAPFRDDHSLKAVMGYNDNVPKLIFVYTDFCGSCLAVKPQIQQLEGKYWGQLHIIYLDRYNSSQNYESYEWYDIRGFPEVILLSSQNAVLEHWRGLPPLQTIEVAIVDAIEAEETR